MAKRVKLNPPQKVLNITAPGMAELMKTVEIQGLMTLPEAEKLRQLDKEMKAIANQDTEPIAEKVREFESKLAEFRELQNKIINKGGVSMIEEHQQAVREEDKALLKDVITNVVRDFLVTSLGGVAGMAPPIPPPAPVVPVPQPPPAAAAAAAQQPQHGASTPASRRGPAAPKSTLDVNDSSVSSLVFSTPPASFSTPKEEEDLTQQNKERNLTDVLKNLGLRVDGGKVFFPTERRSPEGKKYKSEYKTKTLDRVVTYIMKNEAKVPHNTAGALAQVYETLKKSDNFDALVKQYPNLKLVHDKTEAQSFANKSGSGMLLWHTL